MDLRIKDIVILGGGTAGWMTATYLSKAFREQISITLIESKHTPKIGVGEATVPNLQKVFFDFLGVPEDEWLRECNGSFKGAVKFINWRKTPDAAGHNHFYHHFGLIPNCDNVPLSQYWVFRRMTEQNMEGFDYACYAQTVALDANRAPRSPDGSAAFAYAWHMDAHLVAEYLAKLGIKWGVRRVLDDLKQVEFAQDGSIVSLVTSDGMRHHADLFIDCSGFNALLINKALGEPFIDMSTHLLCDSAVACAIPQDDQGIEIEPYTSAIAMQHGWTWKIPMLGRFGTGYVYASNFVSDDEAAAEFQALWNIKTKDLPLKHIRFRTGRNRRAWVRNCVSLGLASCFLEPLESTGIYFIYAAIYQLVKHFPDKTFDSVLIDRFNAAIEEMYDDCRDFIQVHYLTSTRDDSRFWLANKYELKRSEGIKEKLETYMAGLAVNMPVTTEESYYANFETEFRNFWTNSSYYCILAGMGCLPRQVSPKLYYRQQAVSDAEALFRGVKYRGAALMRNLPSCSEYLRALHAAQDKAPLAI